jgi:hypothetical protein
VGLLRQTRRARQKSGSTEPTCDIGPETRVETQLGDFCRGRQTKPISERQELELNPLQKKIYAVGAGLTGSAKQSQKAVAGGR